MDVFQMTEIITEYLTNGGIDYQEKNVQKAVEIGMNEKFHLIQKLRSHPDWNEEELAIIKRVRMPLMKYGKGESLSFLVMEILGLYNEELDFEKESKVKSSFYSLLRSGEYYSGENIDWKDDKREEYFKEIGFKSRKGKRSSRLIREFMVFEGLDKHKDFEKVYAKIGDMWMKENIETTLVISVNPVDYILASNGNTWHSCIAAGGSEFITAFEYLQDNCTLVTYTVNEPDNSEWICKQKKNTRLLLHTDLEETFSFGRCYPLERQVDNMVDAVLDLLKVDKNSLRREVAPPENIISNYIGYCDIFSGSEPDHRHYVTKDFLGEHGLFPASCGAICLMCGEIIKSGQLSYRYEAVNSAYCTCPSCLTLCSCCGEPVYLQTDNGVLDDGYGNIVCSSCGSECERCGCVVAPDDIYYVDNEESEYYDQHLCSNCIDDLGEDD